MGDDCRRAEERSWWLVLRSVWKALTIRNSFLISKEKWSRLFLLGLLRTHQQAFPIALPCSPWQQITFCSYGFA